MYKNNLETVKFVFCVNYLIVNKLWLFLKLFCFWNTSNVTLKINPCKGWDWERWWAQCNSRCPLEIDKAGSRGPLRLEAGRQHDAASQQPTPLPNHPVKNVFTLVLSVHSLKKPGGRQRDYREKKCWLQFVCVCVGSTIIAHES